MQLKEQVTRFLADQSRNQFDRKTNTVRLSMIFGWYGADFEKASSGSVQKFLMPYVSKDLRQWIDQPEVKVEFLDYDWTLNDSRKSR